MRLLVRYDMVAVVGAGTVCDLIMECSRSRVHYATLSLVQQGPLDLGTLYRCIKAIDTPWFSLQVMPVHK
jgi:hypothetical protein